MAHKTIQLFCFYWKEINFVDTLYTSTVLALRTLFASAFFIHQSCGVLPQPPSGLSFGGLSLLPLLWQVLFLEKKNNRVTLLCFQKRFLAAGCFFLHWRCGKAEHMYVGGGVELGVDLKVYQGKLTESLCSSALIKYALKSLPFSSPWLNSILLWGEGCWTLLVVCCRPYLALFFLCRQS